MKSTIIYPLVATILVVPTASWARQRQATDSASPRIRTLALVPAQSDTAKTYALLPSPDEMIDGDAASLYTNAIQMLPADLDQKQLQDWLRLPPAKLPQAKVDRFLQQARKSLEEAKLAAQCRDCDWPPFTPGTMPPDLIGYRTLGQLLCLEARLQITRRQYHEAIGTIQQGLALGKHLGEGPTIIQGLVGTAVAAIAIQQVEALAQGEDSPNLHASLATLPRPLIDLENAIATEQQAVKSSPQYNALTRGVMEQQMEESFTRVRQLMLRLDRDVAALQCIEALRHYAATHDNQLPTQMTAIGDMPLPDNPMTEKPFPYRLAGSKATLDAERSPEGRPRDGIRYEITLAP